MGRNLLILAALFAAFLTIGCGAKDSEGTTSETVSASKPEKVEPSKALIGKWAMQMDTSGVTDPKLKEQLDASLPPKDAAVEFQEGGKVISLVQKDQEGTWAMEGSKLTVKTKNEADMVGTMSEDGKRIDLEMPEEIKKVFGGAKMFLLKV